MKKFLLGVAVAVAVLLLIKYFSDKKESQERLEADTALIQTQIANVSKLVVTEVILLKYSRILILKSTLWICYRLIRKSSQ